MIIKPGQELIRIGFVALLWRKNIKSTETSE